MGFLLRWLFAFALISATYNPTQYNFVRWAMTDGQDRLSITVLAGLVLLVGYVIYLRATLRSIGAFGMGLILAIVGALLWVAYDFGLLDLQDQTLTVWIGIFALSSVLGIGLSWSIVRRKLSGQADVDDVDE
ncbi:DUF6524 family protein [Marivita sp. S6314]|uniref:DUF6524 family protein n=1 Tax=Marivita sp. S6314 TaxID=2926406 RepID=UPI001FF6515B|nr:DUF6524 family protein [Marivita sp. S6314]MCK0149022.1 DUF6524 family protein [Marivita sp. S6314]